MQSIEDGPRVLVVEREAGQSALMESWLRDAGVRASSCADAEAFVERLELEVPDLVCMDLDVPGLRQALELVRRRHPEVAVIVLTNDTSTTSVVSAMRSGAFDCLTKPVMQDRLLTTIEEALRYSDRRAWAPHDDVPEELSYAGIIGRSPQMREVFRRVDRIAGRDISVVIRGESGTGKELIASAIHENSQRAGGPYIAINCAAIPESLQDSELFGHERGSFTGAHKARAGCFERADGGTLFLDEVGELSLGVQAKLLRVLQERRFQRVGGVRAIDSDFRLITATHRRLRDLVEAGKFRKDLYFRIVVFEIEMPPLRARTGDVRLLVPRLLGDIEASLGSGPIRVTEAAMLALERYAFPGNVRELLNTLQSAAVLAVDDEIRLHDLPPQVRAHATPAPDWHTPSDQVEGPRADGAVWAEEPASRARRRHTPTSLEEMPVGLEDIERWAVKRALRENDGRVTEAAKALGIGRTTLYRKLEKYGLR
jgi:DNA-binding NtrC family response regulator